MPEQVPDVHRMRERLFAYHNLTPFRSKQGCTFSQKPAFIRLATTLNYLPFTPHLIDGDIAISEVTTPAVLDLVARPKRYS